MKAQTALFDLIKSLDKNEKRYFRLYASMQKGKKNHISLFSAIEKQKKYDEELLKKKYKHERFTRQLAFTKNYLYNLIMKSLVSYRSGKDIDFRIHLLISQSKILFSKALFPQYFRTLSSAKQMALKYERFGYYLQILDMEKIITPKDQIRTMKTETIYNEAISGIEKLKNTFEYSRLAGLILNNYRTFGTSRDKKQEEILNKILNEPLMTGTEKALSIKSKEIFYWIKEIYNNIKPDYEDVYEALENRYETVSSSPIPFEDNIIDYRSDILCSLVDICIKLNKLEEAEDFLLKLDSERPSKAKSDEIDSEVFGLFAKFRIHLKKDEIKKAVNLIGDLNNLLFKYENKLLIDTELSIRFYIVKCRILEKNFDEALKAANTLMAHPLLSKRADYETYIRIMNLIIHFELKNNSLLRYLIISVYRYLYKKEKLFKLEMLILEFIRKLPGVKNEIDLSYSFELLKKKLAELKKDKYEKNAFEYFDFLSWVDEKIS